MTTPGQGLAIREIAQAFLEGVEEHFAAASVDLPERRYIAPGNPNQIAWDCEQLVVSLTGVGWGQATDVAQTRPAMGSHTSAFALRHAVLSVALVRCTPVGGRNGTPPAPVDIHAAGEQFMRDAGLLSQALVRICSQVLKGLDPTAKVEPGVINPSGPEGGYHGMDASVSITSGNLV